MTEKCLNYTLTVHYVRLRYNPLGIVGREETSLNFTYKWNYLGNPCEIPNQK